MPRGGGCHVPRLACRRSLGDQAAEGPETAFSETIGSVATALFELGEQILMVAGLGHSIWTSSQTTTLSVLSRLLPGLTDDASTGPCFCQAHRLICHWQLSQDSAVFWTAYAFIESNASRNLFMMGYR